MTPDSGFLKIPYTMGRRERADFNHREPESDELARAEEQFVSNAERMEVIESTLRAQFDEAPVGKKGLTKLRRYLRKVNFKRRRSEIPPIGKVKSVDVADFANVKVGHLRNLQEISPPAEGARELRYWENMRTTARWLYNITHPNN